MPENCHPETSLRHDMAPEALFTPEWAALYNPVSRERWDVRALLDPALCEVLCQPALARPPAVQQGLREAGIATDAAHDGADIQSWLDAGWGDALRHYLHSNQLPKLSYARAEGWLQDFATMRQKMLEAPLPESTKSYIHARKRIAAVPTSSEMLFSEVLETPLRQRRCRPTDFGAMANLLSRVFGVSGSKTLAVTGSHVLKTSPSGGSRHPTEAYLLAFDLQGLEPGVYHFQCDRHELELLSPGQFHALYMEQIFGLNRRLGFTPKAALVLTSTVERSMHRYRDARSYRVIHFDVGHLLLSCQLIARSQGLPFFSAYSLGEEAAESLLGIDGLMETAISQMLFG